MRESSKKVLSLIFGSLFVALLSGYGPDHATAYEGFGAATPGGSEGAIVHVTNLNDSGPGSLREALQRGNRTVVFDVGGDIVLSDHVYVMGANVTIDATTAPPPGITLRNRGLIIRGNKGAHDVIVRGLRVRNSSIDGIQIAYGAFNVFLDGVSVSGSLDGDIDVTDSRDVTVSWSILGANGKNMLIKYGSSRITLHHVAFVNSGTRNPQVAVDDQSTLATELVADIRNNVVAGWGGGYGTLVWKGARANVVNNYYTTSGDALTVTGARAYVSGNVSGDGANINKGGTELQPFPSAPVTTAVACSAAAAVLAGAGARPLDAVDQDLLGSITLGCAAPPAPAPAAPAPLAVSFDTTVSTPTSPPPQTTNVKIKAAEWEVKAEIEEDDGDSPADWLHVTPTSGKGPIATFQVAVSSTELAQGLRKAKITVIGKGTSKKQIVPVTLAIDPGALPATATTAQVRIADAADDGAENPGGIVQLSKKNLKIGGKSVVALRFAKLQVPPGAIVESAVLRMFALEGESARASVRYQGEAAGNSAPFNAATSLSSWPRTTAFVDQVLRRWKDRGYQPSADLAPIIQEIVSRPDWAAGNALTLFITGGPPVTSGGDDEDDDEDDDDGGDGGSQRVVGSFETRPTSTRAAVLTCGFRMP